MGTCVAVLRVIAGALPSTLLVVAVFILAVLALALSEKRRQFVLDMVDRMLALAGVLVGFKPDPAAIEGRHL